MTLRSFGLALVLFCVLAPAKCPAAEVTAAKGVLVFWGNVFTPPIHLNLTAEKFTINGMQCHVEPKATTPGLKKPSPDRLPPEYELTSAVFRAASADRANRVPEADVVARARRTLARSSLVKSVKQTDSNTLSVMWSGARAGSGEFLDLSPPGPVPTVEENAASYLAGIASSLEAGRLVVSGNGYDVHLPPRRAALVDSQLNEIRQGRRNVFANLPDPLVETLRHSCKLEKASK